MLKRVLVTGGAGFIGSHTVDLLLAQGLEVIVLDNLSTGKLSYLDLFNPRLRFVQGDVLDFPLLCKEMAGSDAVIHLAALSSVPFSIAEPMTTLKNNLLGFVSVLEAVRQHFKPLRLVYASSAAVYGAAKTLPCSDQMPLAEDSLSPYALEKMSNEHYADLFTRLFNIQSLGLRYFNVYGTRQDPKSSYSGVISKFIECYQKNEPLHIYGDGVQSRDFIHVKDVALANRLALQSDYCGAVNVATGRPHSLNELMDCIEKLGGTRMVRNYLAGRSGDIVHSCGGTEKAEMHLKFRATVSLETGISDLLQNKV